MTNPTFVESGSVSDYADSVEFSPRRSMHGTVNKEDYNRVKSPMHTSSDPFTELFSPTIVKGAGANGYFLVGQEPTRECNDFLNFWSRTSTSSPHGVCQCSSDGTLDNASPSISPLHPWNTSKESSFHVTTTELFHRGFNKDKHTAVVSANEIVQLNPNKSSEVVSNNDWAISNFPALNEPYFESYNSQLFGPYRESQQDYLCDGITSI